MEYGLLIWTQFLAICQIKNDFAHRQCAVKSNERHKNKTSVSDWWNNNPDEAKILEEFVFVNSTTQVEKTEPESKPVNSEWRFLRFMRRLESWNNRNLRGDNHTAYGGWNYSVSGEVALPPYQDVLFTTNLDATKDMNIDWFFKADEIMSYWTYRDALKGIQFGRDSRIGHITSNSRTKFGSIDFKMANAKANAHWNLWRSRLNSVYSAGRTYVEDHYLKPQITPSDADSIIITTVKYGSGDTISSYKVKATQDRNKNETYSKY